MQVEMREQRAPRPTFQSPVILVKGVDAPLAAHEGCKVARLVAGRCTGVDAVRTARRRERNCRHGARLRRVGVSHVRGGNIRRPGSIPSAGR